MHAEQALLIVLQTSAGPESKLISNCDKLQVLGIKGLDVYCISEDTVDRVLRSNLPMVLTMRTAATAFHTSAKRAGLKTDRMEWSGYCAFRRFAVQLNGVLETRGRPLLQPGSAKISLRQFEQLFSGDVAERLRDLPVLLRGARRAEDPLTLSEARTILSCCLLDTLCSVLEKLQWSQISSQSDSVSKKRGSMMLADCALDCLNEALFTYECVQPSSHIEIARAEAFGRYHFRVALTACKFDQAQKAVWCLNRFQTVGPFLTSIILALAGTTAQVSGQAHAGILMLAKITSTVLQVGHFCARLHSTVE